MSPWSELSVQQKEPSKKAKEPETKLDIPQLDKNLFKPIGDLKRKRGIKAGIFGDYGTGKTYFSLTAPEPVFIIDTELGVAPLSHNFRGKKISVKEIFRPDEETLERDDVESFIEIKQLIDWLYKNPPTGGTIVIDSTTDLWKLCQSYGKVKLFGLSPTDRIKYQFDWGAINNLYQQLIMKLLAIPCNLVLTAKTQEIYIGAVPSGTYQPYWQKNTSFYVDMILNNTKRTVKGETTFETEIMKCRFTKDLIGKKYTNMTFDTLLSDLEKYLGD